MFPSSLRSTGILVVIISAFVSQYTNTLAYDVGKYEFPKPLGVWKLSVHDTIKVFDGHTVAKCPDNPTKSQTSPLPGLTTDENTCYNCTDLPTTYTCTNYSTYIPAVTSCPVPAGSCTIHGASGGDCIAGYYTYARSCSLKYTGFDWMMDGAVFRDNTPQYTKNAECKEPDNIPDAGLVVTLDKEKTYMWDNKSPVCIRSGFSNYASLGSAWISDEELKSKILAGVVDPTDNTLTYYDGGQVYETGKWTNRDVQAKGLCSDAESGCDPNPLNLSVLSGPLDHLQQKFTHDATIFVDNAKNTRVNTNEPTRDICDSNRARVKTINRSCRFEIKPTKIAEAIKNNQKWFDTILSPADQFTLTGIMNQPPVSDTPAFSAAIKNLRLFGMSGSVALRESLDVPTLPSHDFLYDLLPGSCMYKLEFDPDALGPLIDKIKPTIKIEAQIGAGLATPDLLLEQEGTSVAGTPATFSTGSYLAGSGFITLTITDAGTSTFTPLSIWDKYNGVSGIDMFNVVVCRTKTHTGMVIDPDCSASPSYPVAGEPIHILSTYNPVGVVTAPHVYKNIINIPDTNIDGIQVAGEYQVYVAVLDKAGNTNIGTGAFNIVPEGFDPTRTRFDKYSDPIIESPATTIYTVSGTTRTPGAAATIDTPSYANAIDTQAYKMSIFDNYGNPIYNWKLYDFGSIKTDIYLNQVDKTDGNALFIAASGGTAISNVSQLGTTDGNGALKFNIYSYTPGEFLEQFKFTYRNWDRNRQEVGGNMPYTFPALANTSSGSFYHIFTGSVDLYTTNRVDLGTANDVMMSFFTTSNTPNTSLQKFEVGNFLESIKSMSPDDFVITNTGLAYDPLYKFDSHYPDLTYLSGATGSFIPEQKGTLFANNLKVEAYPYITLTFSGQRTQYYVSNKQNKFGSGILYDTGSLNRIYIDGLTSTVGKNGYVNNKDNVITNSADTRNAIHKNVALLLRNRTAAAGGGIINRVKYIEGMDVKSSSLTNIADWDVLIIKGGNFIIGDDYNDPSELSTKPLEGRSYSFNNATDLKSVAHKGIIVLQDSNNIGGNIYIKPDVRFIGASLFADESIMSVKYNSSTFDKSNSARTFLLDKQLVIFGNVLSKNTVGGAVRANTNGQYTLPWQNPTISLDEAVNFDLAFLRMDNAGYDDPGVLNAGHNEFVVILTDPRNISNPLPGFLVKK